MSLEFKQGDTFFAQAQYCNALGQAHNLGGITIQAALFDYKNNHAQTLNTTINDSEKGLFQFNAFDTSSLPIGQYALALSYLKDGLKISTNPLGINIVKHRISHINFARINIYSGFTKLILLNSVNALSDAEFNLAWDQAWNANWILN